MTKEKILQDKITYSQSDYYGEINFVVEREDCYEAMDEYAKQECIEFLKWAVKEHSVPFEGFSLSGNRLLGGDTKFVNGEELTMSQFYDLYLQSKSLVV